MSVVRRTRRNRGASEGEGERGRRRTDKRTKSRRRRNIKLNKRSIFCSLFLTGVELYGISPHSFLSGPPPPSLVGLPHPSLLLFITPFLCRSRARFHPLSSLQPIPSFSFPLSLLPCRLLLLCFSFPRVSLFFSQRWGLCVETSRAEEEALYQSRVRSAWFIFYFGRGPNCKINTSS